MAPVGPTQCGAQWRAVLVSFDKQHTTLLSNNPDATEEINLIWTGLVTIGQLIQTSSQQNDNGDTWKQMVDKAESEKSILCKHLNEKALFIRMLGLYSTIHREMMESPFRM
jgi:hypothetical protein